jgi:hypothetical protein
MAGNDELPGNLDEAVEEHGGPFEGFVDEEQAEELRAARLDAFLDRVEGGPPGSCPCCGRPF